MRNLNKFSISDFSENILIIKINKKTKDFDKPAFFLSLSEYLRQTIDWIEVIPAEESIGVKYNSLSIPSDNAKSIILNKLKQFRYQEEYCEKLSLSIPVYYSEEFGLDIKDIGVKHSFSIKEIADLHSSVTYKVKMIGFIPGFAYLGDLPKELIMPRLSIPRINLLPGTVGISGNRTGVYTLGGPGGWRIIGRTPLRLFDPNKKNPFAIFAGMKIEFEPITKQQYKNYTK